MPLYVVKSRFSYIFFDFFPHPLVVLFSVWLIRTMVKLSSFRFFFRGMLICWNT